MTKRLSRALGIATAFVIVVALLKTTPVPVRGQAQRIPAGAAAEGNPLLVTPWGEPDLQGVWNHIYATTLQRPTEYAERNGTGDERRRPDKIILA